MRFTVQLFTGGFFSPAAGLATVVNPLRATLRRLRPERVIWGWNTDDELNRAIVDTIHAAGAEAYLWLPILSEVPPSFNLQPAICYTGEPQQGVAVMPGEEFRFFCPGSLQGAQAISAFYDRYFSALKPDGVFLDKIRQASFAGGVENGFGCFCPGCQKKYLEAGVDPGEVVELLRQEPELLIPKAKGAGRYIFSHPLVDGFFQIKAGIVTLAVSDCIQAFRRKGLQIGLDVYAPVLAPFVAQDLPALAQQANFVKPMFYRITKAPAGIPYELDWLRKSYLQWGAPDPLPALKDIWGIADLCGPESLQAQLKAVCREPGNSIPGFEYNVVPGICEADPEYMRENVDVLLKAGCESAVLSWNLLADSGRNVDALANYL